MAKKLNPKELKQYLITRSREQLVIDITDLYTKIDQVRDSYEGKLSVDYSPDVSEKYKAIIKQEFFPSRGLGEARLSVARRAVSDYQKVSDSKYGLADIMLYYVEVGVDFTEEYGDIDAAFYNSMESMYERAVKYIVRHEMGAQFEGRCKSIVDDTEEMGWGFHDGLEHIYEKYFAKE